MVYQASLELTKPLSNCIYRPSNPIGTQISDSSGIEYLE